MKSIEIIEQSDSEVSVIAFGGIANEIDMPPFEFMGMLSDFNINKIFIRDLDQCWYHKGLRGVTSNIETTVAYLNDMIAGKKTLFTGHSMGGYAAILFGILCGADMVLAFSPQIALRDQRWAKQLSVANSVGGYESLVPLMEQSSIPMKLYFSKPEPQDKHHYQLVPDRDNIDLILDDKSGHHIAKLLKRNGELKDIISTSVLLISP